MKNKFATRLAQLRKKSGMSQKTAAQKLGISQALLSHYEKGIRECGLDFVLKAAKVFDVPCDYLLGATDKLPQESTDPTERIEHLTKKPKLFLGRNKLQNAIDLLYSITARFGNPKMHTDLNNMLFADVYSALRLYEHALRPEKDTEQSLFSLPYDCSVLHSLSMKASSAEKLMKKLSEQESGFTMSAKWLKEEYPNNYDSVMSISETVENEKVQEPQKKNN